MLFRTATVSLIAATATVDASSHSHGGVGLPPNHPGRAVIEKFAPNFRCPHAAEWVSKGPEQAARDMGLADVMATATNDAATTSSSSTKSGGVRRRMQQGLGVPANVAGSCSFTNQFTGPSCVEFRGEASVWTPAAMQERCAAEADSTLSATMDGCPTPEGGMGGWCITFNTAVGGVEAAAMMVSPESDCAQLSNACVSFAGGMFMPDVGCEAAAAPPASTTGGGDEGTPSAGGPPPGTATGGSGGGGPPLDIPAGAGGGPPKCMIAPGAIGAGHQSGFSAGYDPACEGTPAEGSPYMWPMAWRANVESKSMMYGSDDVIYHSKGEVFYRLDKNHKRMDWHYQRGVQRGFGQAPCDPANIVPELTVGQISACRRDTDEYKTMIHRGSKMVFITWNNSTAYGSNDVSQINDCYWLNMAVIGNIRPDWYMDARGDSTAVQYLGNQHVFHENEPRLVKQWRKQDFADQYFVMSVLANTLEDGIHWPMVLNVPGEGVGDDFLQTYTNQSLLTDADDYLFFLDEALESMGGSCPELTREEFGFNPASGNEEVYIPSNLEVDVNAWFDNEFTYSPVWEPTVPEMDTTPADSEEAGFGVVESDRVIVNSCYDSESMRVYLSVEFTGVEMLEMDQMPWLAVGYREDEECKMNPPSGEDSDIILLTHPAPGVNYQTDLTTLPQAARRFDEAAISSITDSATPLAQSPLYSEVYVFAPAISDTTAIERSTAPDSVTLHFKQSMSQVPTAMNLMYAIGSSPEIQFHSSRGCFQVVDFPKCPAGESTMPVSEGSTTNAAPETQPANAKSAQSSGAFSVSTAVCVLASSFLAFILL
mmetsp:Transcript_23907/g.56481  ORF Transcript_23907/g.56481 Transcript_23907/m.56481 type:complete len:823 (+) Transcript_23907:235-2703(+)